MKKLLLSLLVTSAVVAMDQEVTLPTAEILQKRLDANRLTYFAEKTKILSLAGQEKNPLAVAVNVETSIDDYLRYTMQSLPPFMATQEKIMMDMAKPNILKALLQDHPAALTALQEAGVYQPAK